jgi:hypothetical protein
MLDNKCGDGTKLISVWIRSNDKYAQKSFLGGVNVGVLATGHKVRRIKSVRDDVFLKAIEICSTLSFFGGKVNPKALCR